jgi:hypothetical protein
MACQASTRMTQFTRRSNVKIPKFTAKVVLEIDARRWNYKGLFCRETGSRGGCAQFHPIDDFDLLECP